MEDLYKVGRAAWATLAMVLMVIMQSVSGVTTSSTSVLQRFSRSHFAFSLDLYSALIATKDSSFQPESNLLFSPFGVSTVLGMVFLGAGAGSSTSVQLRSALKLNRLGWTHPSTSIPSYFISISIWDWLPEARNDQISIVYFSYQCWYLVRYEISVATSFLYLMNRNNIHISYDIWSYRRSFDVKFQTKHTVLIVTIDRYSNMANPRIFDRK